MSVATASSQRRVKNAIKVLGELDGFEEKARAYIKKYENLDRLFTAVVANRNVMPPKPKVIRLLSVKEISARFKQFEAWWIAAFKHYKLKIKLSFKSIYTNNALIARRQLEFSNAIQQEGLYLETIDTAVRAIKALEDGDNVGLNGLIQSCKSASQTLSTMLFGVVHYLRTGQKVMPIFLLPNGDSYVGQFKEKLGFAQSLLYDADIVVRGNSIQVKDYYREVLKVERNAFSRDFAVLGNIADRNKVMRILDDLNSQEHIVLPVSKRYQEVIRILVNAAFQAGWLSLLTRDESHHSVSKHGVNDNILGGGFEDEKERKENGEEIEVDDSGIEKLSADEKAIYEMIHDKNVQVMAVSATNWPVMLRAFRQVPVAVNEKYCGLDGRYFEHHYDTEGKLIAAGMGVKIRLPEIVGLTQFGSMVGNPDIQHLKGSFYAEAKWFDNYKDRNPDFPYDSHEEYKEAANEAISDGCKWLFANNPKNAQGILIRLHNSNGVAEELATHLEKSLPGVKIVRYFEGSFTTIKELLERYNVGESFYVVIATARGRMSDSFPTNCSYGFDLTQKSSTLGALLQGVLGRMCGYNKNPLVSLSDSNEKRIREYIESDFRKFGGKLLGTIALPKPRATMTFQRKKFATDDRMKTIFDKIDRHILAHGQKRSWGDKNREKIVLGATNTHACFFEILTAQELDYLADLALKETNRPMLMKGETNSNGAKYALTEEGYVVGTVRMQTAGKDDKKGGRHTRKDDDSESVGRHELLMFRVAVRYNQPRLVEFDVPLFQKSFTQGDIINNSCFNRMEMSNA